jgi:predicted GIY-YIG superfamily endonuclease
MFYVYIIRSQKDSSYYTGTTADLEKRLKEHNSGSPRYSSAKRPFKLIWHCVFIEKQKAYDFEKYLKSGSGFAFRNKHLI